MPPAPRISAAQLSRRLQAGLADPVDVAEATLAAMAACEDQAIFTGVLAKRALSEALASRTRLAEGRPASVLDGVPVAWKDLFDIKGRVTTAGSVVLRGCAPAPRDADLVASGARAGLVSVGLTNMTEFAYSGLGLNPHYGTPRNPHGGTRACIPGGSSSGAGVAAARRLVPLAIGTDTGGSVRIPAALNGVVGYKSSTARYPMGGVFPLSPTLDSLGPLAATVEDCVLADSVLRGCLVPQARRGPIEPLRILVPREVVFEGCEAAVRDNFEASLERLARAGAKIEPVSLPHLSRIVDLYARHGTIAAPEAFSIHRARVLGPEARRMDRRVAMRIRQAEAARAGDLAEVLIRRREMIAASNALIGDALVAFPAVAVTAPEIAPLEASDEAYLAANSLVLRNTMLGNFLDWCGISLPNGMDAQGLPTGFLLSAPPGADDRLLSAALAIEAVVIGA